MLGREEIQEEETMQKKTLAALMAATMTVSMLAGCGSSGGSTATTGSPAGNETAAAPAAGSEAAADTTAAAADANAKAQTTTGTNTFVDGGTDLSLWTFQELHVAYYTFMADQWNKDHPDKPINLTVTTGDSSAMHTKLLVALQSGTGAPDIADVEIGHFATFLQGGYLLPLNDVVEPYKNDVIMSRVDMYGDNNGNEYGIDFHLGAAVTYYNMDIMNAAGVNPDDIVTWDDYMEAGKKVLEKTGKPMTAVETSDLFLPQLMNLEQGDTYLDKDGNPAINSEAGAKTINKIREMLDAGVCEIAPGGGFHTEEWYAHFNDGGCASISMPMWYMGRFTDYMKDLKGKIAIKEVPVWNKGDVRCVLQGGTGTGVTSQTKNEALAKEFLAYAKLSEVGGEYIWEKLGFDPIRTEVWDNTALTSDKNNKFIAFFQTNPFDVLKQIKKDYGTELTAPNIKGAYSATYSVLVSTTYVNAFEAAKDTDAKTLLEDEQATIIY
jgi:arabinosaccharide transport system substrate-binding protein